MAAMFETMARQGISRTRASIRGGTRKRNGPMPMASIASTSSETCMVPSSAVNAAPMRAAIMIPVSKGPSSRVKAIATKPGIKPPRSETLQWVAGQQRHREAKKKGNQSHERHRIDTDAFGVAKKTGGRKREASMLNPLERFFERIRDQPEDAAHLAKKKASDM